MFGPDIKEMKVFTSIISIALLFAGVIVALTDTVTVAVIY